MSNNSKRNAFVYHKDPDVYIRQDQEKRPWFPHRVALLIISTRGDSVFLTLPKKASENSDEHVRVPPQGPLLGSGMVKDSSLAIAHDVLNMRLHRDDMRYIGSTYGNLYHGGVARPLAKQIHWSAVTIRRQTGNFNKNSIFYQMGYWVTQNQLLSLADVSMSDRKYCMTLQAILAYDQLVNENVRLARVAGRQLQTS